MKTLEIQAVLECGSVVFTSICVSEDYTMNEVVTEVKRLGYISFRLVETMKQFVKVAA